MEFSSNVSLKESNAGLAEPQDTYSLEKLAIEESSKHDPLHSLMNAWRMSWGLTKSDFREPVNIGSDEMVSMNEMAEMVLT